MSRWWWFLPFATVGCGFDETPTIAACVQGATSTCECSDGSLSSQTCASTGMYGDCGCSAVSAPSTPAGGSSSPGSSGRPGGGSGSGGTASSEPGADPEDAGMGGATGSGGMSGTAGVSGQGGSGGSIGTGGTGEAGQSGGTGGASGGTGGTPPPPPPAPEPGSAYTRCMHMGDCNDELTCTQGNDSGRGNGGGYCAPRCGLLGIGGCPQPTTGTVEATCQQLASICFLGSCANAQCPDGMECLKVPGPFGGQLVATCAYPG